RWSEPTYDVTVDLGRSCSSYDALADVDDLTRKLGEVRFSVYADGVRLWNSGPVQGGNPVVPGGPVALADRAQSRFTRG
ncbi:NPCBM/NEW2 domain-containing protein, partial [Streptomyces sp. JHA26]|uniref:NPCBM/NEW2 domain-containing protein n=1 Tax=Streptomyces sp. JHA26 TaxID=1917143 RepID=UPI0015C574CC